MIRRRATLLVLLVGLAAPTGVTGQAAPREPARPAPDAVARARAARDAADRAWFEASVRREAARRSSGDRGGVVDPAFGEAGPFRIIAAPDRVEEAVGAVERAWAAFEPIVGRPDVWLGGQALVFEWDADPALRVESTGGGPEPARLRISRWRASRNAAEAAESHFSALLGRALSLPAFERIETGRVYRALMMAGSPVVAACRVGDATACWGALGVGRSRPRWRAWIRPEQYASAVARLRDRGVLRDPETFETLERCVSLGEPDVCEEVMLDAGEQAVLGTTPPPLRDQYLRMDLAVFAARRGGSGAYERLQPSLGGDFRDRIGAAAQEDPDEVVLAWVREALSGGVDRSEESRRHRSAALLWYLLLAIPAARSSRWRIE